MKKLWGGRFSKQPEEWVDEFGASISFDQQLASHDIKGSLAHAKMLFQCGIIEESAYENIKKGLLSLQQQEQEGELSYSVKYEDIHLNLEKLLTDNIGPDGGKLHTARSRNDQVATDFHLYVKEETLLIMDHIEELQKSLLNLADEHVETIIPGYTHLQRAQPVSFAHHLLAYFWMLDRDKERLQDSLKRTDIMPLGAGALAGTTFDINRNITMTELGFSGKYPNSLDAVSDRDFAIECCSNASMIMMHLSRFCEELILWSSEEFGFIEISDSFTTGSSMMPQKKNPDMAELIRGKSGRVFGSLVSLLTLMKGLPLAYNKDMQEDKEPVFDTVKTVKGCLSIMTGMMNEIKINVEKMNKAVHQDFSNATELADYLAKKGIPFREAHELVGQMVLHCIQKGCYLLEISIEEYKEWCPLVEKDLYDALSPKTAVERRNSEGGTGFDAVRQQIDSAKSKMYISKN
ncbi:argininosuccinate lyase [Fictibacillus barbaricus]|uniref:Argininosuccinate lyase n=1 Tax=Fictibacillus barbaricus TaxID=182136 RepID=A0ABS2ZGN6_9BACL|nr:argininosuccinate lyase [Fictibacillus barbaricus]MBN3547342.1 argininosuccinate lyase [Fictibacillus barbaricus]GGB48289.1 argininosuccinate lyase [Fictibacillus barbaricus]